MGGEGITNAWSDAPTNVLIAGTLAFGIACEQIHGHAQPHIDAEPQVPGSRLVTGGIVAASTASAPQVGRISHVSIHALAE